VSLYRKSIRIVGVTLLVYVALVATHLGEFWPFSIYPMFSQAGNPWTRTVVREVPDDATKIAWQSTSLTALPGHPFPVVEHGISQNDIANYVTKTSEWTGRRTRGFRSLFARNHDFTRPLLVFKVRGALVSDSVSIEATPMILMERDTTRFNPSLRLASPSE